MSELDDIKKRLDRIESRTAIGELCTAYAIACDDRDMKTIADIFTEDCVFRSKDGMMVANGRQSILEMYRGRFRVLAASYHWTHDLTVKFDDSNPNHATGLTLGHAEVFRNNEPLIAAMRYEDEYRREDGKWRFSKRSLSFLYYVNVHEYPTALGETDRMRAYGDRRPADYPESLPTWTTWEQPVAA